MTARLSIEEGVRLAPCTTFGIGGPARFFARASSAEGVAEALDFAARRSVPVFVLGGGSNLLVADAGFDGLVVHAALTGPVVAEGEAEFDVPAGMEWDALVRLCCERDLAGMECLAGIPGLTGAAPIQNIGAYGQEAAATIVSVSVLDLEDGGAPRVLPAAACGFRYRSSVFNGTARGRYVVTGVRFRLLPGGAPSLRYADLAPLRDTAPSLLDVYHFVRTVRGRKGMLLEPGPSAERDPDTRSAGSFFKNPVAGVAALARIAGTLAIAESEVPRFPVDAGHVKLPAAWLIERAGFARGFALSAGSGAAISSRHTLALVNRSGTCTCAELLALRDRIRATVEERFGIALEQEPVLLG